MGPKSDHPSDSPESDPRLHTTESFTLDTHSRQQQFHPRLTGDIDLDNFVLEREERLSDLHLRERISSWILWFYGASIAAIGFFGILEVAGKSHLGESFNEFVFRFNEREADSILWLVLTNCEQGHVKYSEMVG